MTRRLRSKSSEHDADHSETDEGDDGCGVALEVARQAAISLLAPDSAGNSPYVFPAEPLYDPDQPHRHFPLPSGSAARSIERGSVSPQTRG